MINGLMMVIGNVSNNSVDTQQTNKNENKQEKKDGSKNNRITEDNNRTESTNQHSHLVE